MNYAWTEDWTLRRQICYFLDISGKVLSLIRFANDPYTLYNRLNVSILGRFRKARNRVNRGKTQCWALFVISKATFTKTAIKPKFHDRFPLKNFSAAIDQCAIKCPIFLLRIETFQWNDLKDVCEQYSRKKTKINRTTINHCFFLTFTVHTISFQLS